jgi:hypothetical protein
MISEPAKPQLADDSGTETELSKKDPKYEFRFKKRLRIVYAR